ncbi:MAG TPA: ATP-binding protein [Turneriella sp.]|nr:ATP-binding protein [Turneriella sp.]HNL53479.1 ATP-binding protein [Turneriella sp.]
MSLRQALATFASVAHKPHWLIAFSAGADSVLLLDLAVEAALRSADIRVTAFYLHHYSTPVESERRRAISFMASRARQLLGDRFAFCELSSDITMRAHRLRRSWEHTASLVRRRHLERLARRLGGAQVFTGHQLSDYRETLQLRAERCVPRSAWPALSVHDSNTDFLRPLAFFTREQVRAFARDRGLSWFEDPSNSDTSIARNRLRATEQPGENILVPPEHCTDTSQPKPRRVHPREMRMPETEWRNLAPVMRARAVYQAWQQLFIVKRFTRNDFARAQRLPFSLRPFFAHAENFPEGEFIVFRRGLGSMSLNSRATQNSMRGDAITRAVKLRQPYGHKAVTKIFSERRLSPRQRRLTWLEMADSPNEALRIFFPDGAVL